ncbi:MAG TPA: MCE family protein [Egibacteraceae bacterium]|nr:MCE family protein [Egibacteraceae bacterium]
MTGRLLRLGAAVLAAALLASACSPGLGEGSREVSAIFANTNNLFVGSEVRVLGLQVGEVTDIVPSGDHVRVDMVVRGQPLPSSATADLTPVSLIGERFVQLDPPYTDGPELENGAVLGIDRTSVPTDVDEVLASFERFLTGLEPETLAELVDTLADTLAGQGEGLNQLIDGSADTIRVLSDSTDDLTAIVSELADLNTTLATRDQQIGPLLTNFRTVLQTVTEEKPHIVEGLGNLQRLTVELRPLLADHTDPLVGDLEVLATTLSTVDRNLERIGALAHQGRRLFGGWGGAFEYPEARIPLQNQTEELEHRIDDRLMNRLAGVCIRLGHPECADPAFFAAHLHALACDGEDPGCQAERAGFGQALAAAIGALPDDAQRQLEAEARERLEAEQRTEEQRRRDEQARAGQGDPPAPGGSQPGPDQRERRDLLPLPDPRLPSDDEDRPGPLRRLFGGAS